MPSFVLLNQNTTILNHIAHSIFSGVFTAPVDGDYQLIVKIFTNTDTLGKIYFRRNHDDILKPNTITHPENINCTAVPTLRKGDRITVTGNNNQPGTIKGYDSGFAGYLFRRR